MRLGCLALKLMHYSGLEKHPEFEDQDKVREESMEITDQIRYRDRPIRNYVLAASRTMIGHTPWMRLPIFLEKVVISIKGWGRDYLFGDEILRIPPNSDDYVRISCQLGLIETETNEEQDLSLKRYRPTNFAARIAQTRDIAQIREIILESILDIVRSRKEVHPDEKHAVLLLWLLLNIKNSGAQPHEHHFTKATDKPDSFYPRIRLNFAQSLCSFLFTGNSDQEWEFLTKWRQCM